jgi:hypothetical protein
MRAFTLLLLGLSLASQPAAVRPAAGHPASVQKVLALFADLKQAKASKKKVRFQLTESEVNEYLFYTTRANPRPGLHRMRVKLYPGNYISTFSIIDFDAVELAAPGTIPPLLRPILSGRREVAIDLRLHTNNGHGTASIEKAYFDSVRVPARVMEKVINSIGSTETEEVDLSQPAPLPFGLREVRTAARLLEGEN